MEHTFIREMQRSDLPNVLLLYQQPEVDNGNGLSVIEAESILDKVESYPFYRFYVATRNESEIVGVYGLLIMENLGHKGASSGLVEGVCVTPSMHGQGIGKAMMRHAMDICHQRGCYKLALSSNVKRSKAHAFYLSLGFKQHGLSFLVDLADQS